MIDCLIQTVLAHVNLVLKRLWFHFWGNKQVRQAEKSLVKSPMDQDWEVVQELQENSMYVKCVTICKFYSSK